MDWFCLDCNELVEEPAETEEVGIFECPHCGSTKVVPIT